MSFRRDAGYKLAKSGQCKAVGKIVRVPSRSKPGTFHLANLRNLFHPRCGCKDNVVNNQTCAHIWAARFVLEWEAPGDAGSPPTKDPPKSYPRNWAAYNLAEVESPTIAYKILAYLAQHTQALFPDESEVA